MEERGSSVAATSSSSSRRMVRQNSSPHPLTESDSQETTATASSSSSATTSRSGRSTRSASSGTNSGGGGRGGVDRRQQLFERHWQSMQNLNTRQPSSSATNEEDEEERSRRYDVDDYHRLPSIPAIPTRHPFLDLSHFQESWTTGDVTELFGASSSTHSHNAANPSYVDFGGMVVSSPSLLLDRPDRACARLSSTATAHSTTTTSSSSGAAVAAAAALTVSSSSPQVDSWGVSSVIHDAARITNWDQVLELCETMPEAARYVGRDGWTALHHACSRRCPYPNVVEALIRAYPGALMKQDKEKWGWVPLHYACRFKAPQEVVNLLLHMYPERGLKTVSKRDHMGRTPLFYAIRYDAPPGVVGLLLKVDPSAVLEEDQNADSPLALVWDSWAEKMEGKRVVASFLPGGFPEPEDTTVEQRAIILRDRLKKESKLHKRWLKANMLLKAAFGFPVDDTEDDDVSSQGSDREAERRWRIVHATAAVKCHLSLFLLACALHPEQIQEIDEFDLRRPGDPEAADQNPRQTALHLAASSNSGGEPGKTVLLTLLSQYREAAQIPDGIDESLPLHRMVENPRKHDWSNHAAILYRFYPRAVQIADSSGKLPLHRAAAAVTNEAQDDEESVILQLLRVFPQAASHADLSGLLPLHLLASHAQAWDSGVEAVYNIHRNAVLVRTGPRHHHRLPLHMAAASHVSRESLLSRLLLHHPRAASMPDDEGKLPFHLACEIGKSWNNGSRCLHSAFPNAVRTREDNARGWFPLHMAAQAPEADADLITRLVELHPQAASIPDADGRYPLHLACRAGKSWLDGISVLFDVDPSPMACADHNGMLPLHLAAFRYCSTGIVEEEDMEFEDATAQVQEAKVAQEAAQIDILFHLLRADPTILEGCN